MNTLPEMEQNFLLGCRLIGKDTALIRQRSRIIPEWPNNNKILKIYIFNIGIYSIMVSTADSDSAGLGSNPGVPTNENGLGSTPNSLCRLLYGGIP